MLLQGRAAGGVRDGHGTAGVPDGVGQAPVGAGHGAPGGAAERGRRVLPGGLTEPVGFGPGDFEITERGAHRVTFVQLDQETVHLARTGRRDVHGGFVGFHFQNVLVGFDAVAGRVGLPTQLHNSALVVSSNVAPDDPEELP